MIPYSTDMETNRVSIYFSVYIIEHNSTMYNVLSGKFSLNRNPSQSLSRKSEEKEMIYYSQGNEMYFEKKYEVEIMK